MPIAGIAMGLVIESGNKFAILTDITGIEDGNGDMDFKVAGSSEGITALQLDVKTLKLTPSILKEAFKQAKKARLEILKVMAKAIDKPRKSVSKYAPKIKIIRIEKEKIGELIGPGGRNIKKIIAETNAQIDVDDDGSVFVSSVTEEGLVDAVNRVELVVKEPQPGEIYKGEVKKLMAFGAFVEILPGKEGLVHVSDMSEGFVQDPSDIVAVGDEVQVRVKKADDLGRLNLSMNLDPESDKKKMVSRRDSGGSRRGRFNKRSSGRKYDKKTTRSRDFSGQGSRGNDRQRSGPHFPTSRFFDQDSNKRR
jgi:polyribonucleotide nucleotidyltransferase